MFVATAAAAAAPDEGFGKLIGVGVAIFIAWLVITTKERYWPTEGDSQDATPLPRKASGAERGKTRLSRRHASIDTAREQQERRDRRRRDGWDEDDDSTREKGDSRSREGRQPKPTRRDSRPSRHRLSLRERMRNLREYGQPYPPEAAAEADEDVEEQWEEEPGEIADEVPHPGYVPYRPDSAPAAPDGGLPDEVIDLELDEQPEGDDAEDKPTITTKEQLIGFLHRRRWHEGAARDAVYAEAMKFSGRSVSTIDRAMREAQDHHNRGWRCPDEQEEKA